MSATLMVKPTRRRRSFPSVAVFVCVTLTSLGLGVYNRSAAHSESSNPSSAPTSQPNISSKRGGGTEQQLRMRREAALAQMMSASQQLNETNLKLMQMEMSLGAKHPKCARADAVAI